MKAISKKFREGLDKYYQFKKKYLSRVLTKVKSELMRHHCQMVEGLSALLKSASFPKRPVKEKTLATQKSITQSYLLSKNTRELEVTEDDQSNLFSESNVEQENEPKQTHSRAQQVGLKQDVSNSLIKSKPKTDSQGFFEFNSQKLSVIKPKNSFMASLGLSFNPLLADEVEVIQEVSRDNSELEPTLIMGSNKKTGRQSGSSRVMAEEIQEETHTNTQVNSQVSRPVEDTEELLVAKASSERSLNQVRPKQRISNLAESRTLIRNSGIFSKESRLDKESEFFYDVSEINSLPRDSLSLKPAAWTKSKSTMSRTLDLQVNKRSPTKLSKFNTQNLRLSDFESNKAPVTPPQPKKSIFGSGEKESQTKKSESAPSQDDHLEYLPTFSDGKSLRYSYSGGEEVEESSERVKKIEQQIMDVVGKEDREIIEEYNNLGDISKRKNSEQELLKDLMREEDLFEASDKKRASTFKSIEQVDSLPDFLNNF